VLVLDPTACVFRAKQSRAHGHTHPIRRSQREGSVEFDAVPSMPPQETSSTQHTGTLSDGVQIQTLMVRRVERQNCFDMHFVVETSVIAYTCINISTAYMGMERVGVMVKQTRSQQARDSR
jgi:hypothetical protein